MLSLDRIIAGFADTDLAIRLAIRLAAGQDVNGLSRRVAMITAAVARSGVVVPCQRNSAPDCVLLLALNSAMGATDAIDRDLALLEIARVRAQVRTIGDAVVFAQLIESDDIRVKAIGEVARAETDAALRAGAVAVARRLPDPEQRASALAVLASATGQRPLLNEALQAAERIADAWDRELVLGDIAASMTALGQVNRALRLAHELEMSYPKSEALSLIAEARAQAGDWHGGLQTVRTVEDPTSRVYALEQIQSKPNRF